MLQSNDDLRIRDLTAITSPAHLIEELPRGTRETTTVERARRALHDILHQDDDRLIVVVGPCSIHDPSAALDYADRLSKQRARFSDDLELVMRVYFEKPRTTVGWKGLINDPHLDGSFRIEEGLRVARRLLLDINDLTVPAGCEFLEVMMPQYIADLVSWGAIGARTTESQVHRQLASGLSCPVGFKNGTTGDLTIALEAMSAASHPHHFLGLTKEGRAAIASTTGNEDCHIILRGGRQPNYDTQSVEAAAIAASRAGLPVRIMVDASHANSGKDPANQPHVLNAVGAQVAAGDHRIIGVMIESHIVAGRQDLRPSSALVYGQSITDGCVDWPTSMDVFERLASSVRQRRQANASRPQMMAL